MRKLNNLVNKALIQDFDTCPYDFLTSMVDTNISIQPKNIDKVIKLQEQQEEAICLAYEEGYITEEQMDNLLSKGRFTLCKL